MTTPDLTTTFGVLRELVELKDLHDRVENWSDDSTTPRSRILAMQDDYNRRKPIAWAAARALVAPPVLMTVSHRVSEPPAPTEPDMRHPKIQRLIGLKARREIELQLVEQLLEDPEFETTALDMEYWNSMHDKLKAALTKGPKGKT